MKKVLFVTRPMVPPWSEGSKKLVWHIASHLRQFEPHLLTTATDASPPVPEAIRWHSVYRQAALTAVEKGRLVRFLYGRLPKVDLIHSYFVPSLATSLAVGQSKRRHHLPMIQTVPSLPSYEITSAQARRLYYGDKVVTYTADSANRLMDWKVKNVVHINVGISIEKYEQARPDPELRANLGIAQDDVMILFSGEYTRLGAIDRLRRIMPQVLKQNKQIHFVFACRLLLPADEPIKQALQKEVAAWGFANRIHFVGEVAHFPTLLKSADLFIFPVREMNGKIETPLTLIEAMAAGLPVVTSDIYPLRHIFPPDVGILLPVDDDAQFGQCLLKLADDPARRQAVGAAGQAFVSPRFGMKQMVANYEAVYTSVG